MQMSIKKRLACRCLDNNILKYWNATGRAI
ncbi:hypothetical protein NC653_015609 [Populus alba x Populus x berolinensis]|uniref:Uncharacterized protein n=1 Tax=Populus alba x Populus x berolinensis TaxID=444605 RepID=A0AAD6QKY5_9ROSI|nr:hypothetical protein NC653_015609 [Populus alba x Populus x berolinensis]